LENAFGEPTRQIHCGPNLGTQGDIWDAQKDLTAAFIGATLVALWLMLRQRRT
jgi:uncharacterized membrane protein YjdF